MVSDKLGAFHITHLSGALLHAVAEGVIEQSGNLARCFFDRFGLARPCCQSAVESPKSGIATPDSDRSQTQQGRRTAGRSSRTR